MGQQTSEFGDVRMFSWPIYIIIGESNLKRLCALKPRILEAHLCNIEGIQTKLCPHVNIYEHVSLTDKVWFTWSATTLLCSPVMWQTKNTPSIRNMFRGYRWPFTQKFAFVMLCLWPHKFYPLVNQHSYGKSPFLIGKPSINGPFSMAMLNNQRVFLEPPQNDIPDHNLF